MHTGICQDPFAPDDLSDEEYAHRNGGAAPGGGGISTAEALTTLTVKQLRETAKFHNADVPSRATKQQLIDAIEAVTVDVPGDPPAPDDPDTGGDDPYALAVEAFDAEPWDVQEVAPAPAAPAPKAPRGRARAARKVKAGETAARGRGARQTSSQTARGAAKTGKLSGKSTAKKG